MSTSPTLSVVYRACTIWSLTTVVPGNWCRASWCELKKQNLDRAVSVSWYRDFFEKRLDQTSEVQADFIDYRINLQNAINDDEWAQIIELASSAERKELEKAEKQANKKKGKDLMDNLRQTANEIIVNPDSKKKDRGCLEYFEREIRCTC